MAIIIQGTECPTRELCQTARAGLCNHQGPQHRSDFQCKIIDVIFSWGDDDHVQFKEQRGQVT